MDHTKLDTYVEPSLRHYHDEDTGYQTFRMGATQERSTVDRRPQTEAQAVMEAAPFDEAEESLAEAAPLLDAIALGIDSLEEQQRFIIEALHYERLSYAELALRLGVGKTQAFRLAKQAEEALKEVLLESPHVRERIEE